MPTVTQLISAKAGIETMERESEAQLGVGPRLYGPGVLLICGDLALMGLLYSAE